MTDAVAALCEGMAPEGADHACAENEYVFHKSQVKANKQANDFSRFRQSSGISFFCALTQINRENDCLRFFQQMRFGQKVPKTVNYLKSFAKLTGREFGGFKTYYFVVAFWAKNA
jgi:hypothetical protein